MITNIARYAAMPSALSPLRAAHTPVAVPTDGPASVYLPTSNAHWALLGIPTPDYWYKCQDASGNLAEANGGTVLTANGTAAYQQSVAGWTTKSVQISETANERFGHASGAGINPSTTSIAMLVYVALTTPAATRYIVNAAGTAYSVRVLSNDLLQLATNSAVVNGTVPAADLGVIPLLYVVDRTGGTSKLYTKDEVLTGIYVAPASDGTKAIGGVSATSAPGDYVLAAMWAGANAEAQDAQTLRNLGWSVAY
jgi:hypothetical protein